MGTLLFGAVYPLIVWSVAHLFFPFKAEGSKVFLNEKCVGLHFVGQTFVQEKYFWARPSWSYRVRDRLISGGSNLSWSSPLLRASVESKSRAWRQLGRDLPEDLVMASASGCDPEISLNAALIQVPRIARARGLSEEEVMALVRESEEPSFGKLFPKRVNVLRVNVELDGYF